MKKYIQENRLAILMYVACVGIFAVSFALYHLPLEAVIYPSILCLIILFSFFVYKYITFRKKHNDLQAACDRLNCLEQCLKQYNGTIDEDYEQIINLLIEESNARETKIREKTGDMVDYYTTWVHQIKTPIASIRLTLQDEDSAVARRVLDDLFRIEQYVDMVLTYVKLDYSGIDYVVKEQELDGIVKSVIRKFAAQFIKKGLKLDYQDINYTVVTDEKWLAFAIEQVLSNAIKYTTTGGISIYVENDNLCIRDTGIGIDSGDLPRLFEKGYTGFNGRVDRRASGIGLYISKRILTNLGHGIAVESEVGVGTTVKINLSRRYTDHRE